MASTSRQTTSSTAAAPRARRAATASGAAPRATRSNRPRASRSAPPSHEQIEARAYDLFVSSGCQHGRAVEFWLAAERELKAGLKT
jgi:hypothetical protein